MRSHILAGVAGISMLAMSGMALAQQTTNPSNQTTMQRSTAQAPTLTADQQARYDRFDANQRANYDRMTGEMQSYYWTLDDTQRDAWWLLTEEQRTQLYRLPAQQRTAAWTSLRQQMSTMNAPGSASSTMTSGATRSGNAAMGSGTMSGNIRFVSTPVVQNIPMDQATGEVPVCGANQFDNCINAYEAGRRGPNVTRPLDYYPGEAGPTNR